MNCLGRFKTTQTMYYDYNRCYWDVDKPEGTCGLDYALLRNGTKLEAYTLQEEYEYEGDSYKVELTNGNHQVYFKDLEDLNRRSWLEEIKNDNTPLKFEDLKEGMWVWDNKEKCYGKVVSKKMQNHGLLSLPGLCWGKFKENRFYAMEVKENE